MLEVKVRTENAAFGDHETGDSDFRYECARILRTIADKLEEGEDASHYLTVFDTNGNDCGRWKAKR